MTDKKINGWSNYETWLVALWLDNERSTYEAIRELVVKGGEAYVIGDYIKGIVEEINESNLQGRASLTNDLVNAAMGEVDFREIAQNLLNEAKEEIKGEEN